MFRVILTDVSRCHSHNYFQRLECVIFSAHIIIYLPHSLFALTHFREECTISAHTLVIVRETQ